MAETGADRLIGAGVVMPGPFGVTGLSGAASDLPGWAEEDALARLSQALDLPVAKVARMNGGETTQKDVVFLHAAVLAAEQQSFTARVHGRFSPWLR